MTGVSDSWTRCHGIYSKFIFCADECHLRAILNFLFRDVFFFAIILIRGILKNKKQNGMGVDGD